MKMRLLESQYVCLRKKPGKINQPCVIASNFIQIPDYVAVESTPNSTHLHRCKKYRHLLRLAETKRDLTVGPEFASTLMQQADSHWTSSHARPQ